MATVSSQVVMKRGEKGIEPLISPPATTSIEDWPNEAGFQTLHEEREPVELRTVGKIPSYAAGALYRTGPSSYKVDRGDKGEFAFSHWFDGFGHTHRFEIVAHEDKSTRVFYNSRRANDKLIEKVKETGNHGGITFAQKNDPCIGIFGKVMSAFKGLPKDPSMTTVHVTLRANLPGLISNAGHAPNNSLGNVRSLWSLSDNRYLKELDPLTLEPIGITTQKALHPSLSGPLTCAHAQTDPETGDLFNFNTALGRNAVYRVFKTSAATGETEIIATISGHGVRPAYLHSFFMTQDFIILSIWGAHLDGVGLGIITNQNLVDALAPFDSSRATRWFVIDRRHGQGLVAEFDSPAAFCFHTINAWQEVDEDRKTNIICEFPEYENTDIIHALSYSNMTSTGKDAVTFQNEKGNTSLPSLVRYRLSNIKNQTLARKIGRETPKAEQILSIPKRQGGELPTMNPKFSMKESRYVYSIINRGYSAFFDGLSKVDMKTKNVLYWDNPKGHTPGEAIFVPNPEGIEEDEGVLLSIVLDGFKETSYLICLDARNMKELGRAECQWPVGLGFHGLHIGQ